MVVFNLPNKDNFIFMKEMAIKGLKMKGVYDDPWYQDQLNMELKIIDECGLEDFFLNTAYICALIDQEGIFRGPARGSALASVLCFGLNITKIPPKEHKLSFARFLNKTRVKTSLPDIDTDVSSDRREDVLNLIINEFGEEYCAQVITRLRYTPKMAIKTLAKISGVPFQEVNRVTAVLTDNDTYRDNDRVMYFLNQHPFIRDNIDSISGLLKAHGKHPGALIITDKPIYNYASVNDVKGTTLISNTGEECISQGLLKNDTLSVKVLDIQRDCLELINDSTVELPVVFDDSKVFETINRDPLGIFQLEKGAGRQGLKLVQPDNFNELVAVISLIRPGARNSGMDKLYADYKFGRKEPEYLDERLKDVLADTKGLMIFQEDSMAVARELAQMSDLETDNLRNAISKKKKEAFTEFKPKFINGCINNNVREEVAEQLWNNIEKSSDYSFNRSHAVGYAVLGYQSAWLKTYYPLQFAIAMLKHVKEDEKRIEILQSIKKSNVELYPPDINKSELNTVIKNNAIYMGFDLIDKVSVKASEAIVEERKANGNFKSFDEFCERVAPRKANKTIKENLILAGAFDNLPIGGNKQTTLDGIM